MGAPFTGIQLRTPQTLADVEVQFLALLQGGGFPALTEWAGEPTGTEMTFVKLVAQALNQLAGSGAPVDQQIASVAAGRWLTWARGGWLDLLAEQVYLLSRGPATSTTFVMTLVSVPAAPAYEFQVGDVWVVGPTGKRYQSTTAGNLQPGGNLEMQFRAEAEGSAYADDPAIVDVQAVTAPAGVSLLAGGGDFSIVTSSGVSPGRVQPVRTDPAVAPSPHAYGVQVTGTGDVGAAFWALQVDGGVFVPKGVMTALNDLGDGASFQAISSGSPSFVAGDVFSFSTPGTTQYVQGNDVESDASLAQRCRDRWPAQSLNVMDGKVRLWSVAAYPSLNRVRVAPDLATAGGFVVTGADTHGAISSTAITAIEQYVRARLSRGEHMSAQSAQNLFVLASGNVKVTAGTTATDLEAIQGRADDAWRAYLASVDIGQSEVKLSKLNDVLIDAGAVEAGDLSPLVLSTGGVSWPVNVVVPDGFVPVAQLPISLSLTWGFA